MLEKILEYLGGYNKAAVLKNDGNSVVSIKGVKEICELVGISGLPEYFDFEINNKQGKIANRIDTWLRDWEGIKLNNSQKAEIGTIADQNATPSDISYVGILEGIMRWDKSGTFRRGGGSCYYGGMSDSRAALESVGGASLVFLRPGGGPGRNICGGYNGIGRAFLIPYKGTVIMCNIYTEKNNQKKAIADACLLASLALGEEVSYNSISFKAGSAHINGENGYQLLRSGDTMATTVSLKRKSGYGCQRCQACRNHVYSYPADNGNRRLCTDCGDICGSCGKNYEYYYLTYFTDKEKWYCESCVSSIKPQACECGKVYSEPTECECGGE